MRDEAFERAAGRVTLACRALSAAVDDLAVAHRVNDMEGDERAQELEVERERVCQLAEELTRRVEGLGALAQVRG
jgi:hypothetical protein